MSFDLFNRTYVSPSDLNLWGSNPALWIVRYGMGLRGKPTPKMVLGSAVELGVQSWIIGTDFDQAVLEASNLFSAELLLYTNKAEVAKARELIEPMMKMGIQGLAFISAGPPKLYQNKVTTEIEGLPVPCMGFTDFEWDEILIDLKTTSRMPSKPKPAHLRQVAFYWKATGKTPALMYVTPKDYNVYTPSEEELGWAWDELCYYARTLRNALSDAVSAERMLARYPADFGDFMWDEESRSAAKAALKKLEKD